MIEYFELFGDKFCCHEDLTIFTELLNDEEEKQVFFKMMNKLIKRKDSTFVHCLIE